MTRLEKKLQIQGLQNIFRSIGEVRSKLLDDYKVKPNAPVLWCVAAIEVNAVTNAAMAIGDIGDSLNRFIYENKWGERGLDGVHSIDDFLDEMEQV